MLEKYKKLHPLVQLTKGEGPDPLSCPWA